MEKLFGNQLFLEFLEKHQNFTRTDPHCIINQYALTHFFFVFQLVGLDNHHI